MSSLLAFFSKAIESEWTVVLYLYELSNSSV